MNKWLVRAPWWALAMVMGLCCAVPFALSTRLGQGVGWPAVIAETVVFVLVCGPVTGVLMRRHFDRHLEGIGDAPEALRDRVASRPTAFGPIPEDPAERAATVRLIEHQIGELSRKRMQLVVAGVLVAAPLVWMSLTRSPWLWLLAAAWFLLIGLGLWSPALLRRRAALLRQE